MLNPPAYEHRPDGGRVYVQCPACTMPIRFQVGRQVPQPDGSVAVDVSLTSAGIRLHLEHGCVGS